MPISSASSSATVPLKSRMAARAGRMRCHEFDRTAGGPTPANLRKPAGFRAFAARSNSSIASTAATALSAETGLPIQRRRVRRAGGTRCGRRRLTTAGRGSRSSIIQNSADRQFASASASWMRTPARHNTTIIARTRPLGPAASARPSAQRRQPVVALVERTGPPARAERPADAPDEDLWAVLGEQSRTPRCDRAASGPSPSARGPSPAARTDPRTAPRRCPSPQAGDAPRAARASREREAVAGGRQSL
jgi:hypothetical protein